MKRRYFFENITAIVTYAVAGTTISSVTVGLILYVVGYNAWSIKLSLAEALSFGALISATVNLLLYWYHFYCQFMLLVCRILYPCWLYFRSFEW